MIHEFLSPDECAEFILASEGRGFRSAESDYPPSYRNNDRQVIDDDEVAKRLHARLREKATQAGLEACIVGDETAWHLVGLNERIRFCRYRPGQQFRIHQDGVHHRGADCRSRLTFMIYLSDGATFEGGDTLFYASAQALDASGSAAEVIARLRPRVGSLIVFDHAIWHAGDTLTRGMKYILRSDLLYLRSPLPTPTALAKPFAPSHEGYVWTIARLSNGRLATGGRDGAIRLWNEEGSLRSVLTGHRQSVLGIAEVHPGRLASVSRDRTLRIWDLATQSFVRSVDAHAAAILALATDGDHRLITGGVDHQLAIWTAEGDSLGKLHGHDGWVWTIAALGHGRVVSASEDGRIKLWDLERRASLATWAGEWPLRTLDAIPVGKASTKWLIASGDIGGSIVLREVDGEQGSVVASKQGHAGAIRKVRFVSPTLLVTCGEDGPFRRVSSPAEASPTGC